MNKTVYEKDAIDMFNKYYNKNNNDIKDTLLNMEKDRIIPYFFMKYFIIYTDFLEKFNIEKNIYKELKLPLWMDQDIIRPNKIIDHTKCTRPIPKTKQIV